MYLKLFRSTMITLVLLFSTSLFALDLSKLPQGVQDSIYKYYKNQKIKVISITRKTEKYILIIKTKSGKDKVVVTNKGKILNISEYLIGIETIGGC